MSASLNQMFHVEPVELEDPPYFELKLCAVIFKLTPPGQIIEETHPNDDPPCFTIEEDCWPPFGKVGY